MIKISKSVGLKPRRKYHWVTRSGQLHDTATARERTVCHGHFYDAQQWAGQEGKPSVETFECGIEQKLMETRGIIPVLRSTQCQ